MACELRNVLEIVPYSEDFGPWSVIIQVLYKSPVLTARSQRKYRNYLFTDMMGTRVSAVTYDNHSEFFENTLHPYQRYKISNAQVSPAEARFRVSEYEYSWVIKNRTPVEPVEDSEVYKFPCSFNTVKMSHLYRHADKNDTIDIKGLVIHRFPPAKQANGKLMKIYILVDEEKIPILLRLWCEKGLENEHEVDNLDKGPVYLVASNVIVSTFHGLSLNSRYNTHLIQEPPMEGVAQIKDWYMNNKDEISVWRGCKIYQNIERFFLPPPEEEVRDLHTVVHQIAQLKTTWMKAKIELVETGTKPWYVVCENCTKWLDAMPNTRTYCNFCRQWMITDIRTHLVARFRSGNETMLTTINSPDTDFLINMTPEEVKEAYYKGIPLHAKMTEAIRNRTVVCFIKSYESEFKGEKTPKFPTLRLFLDEHLQLERKTKENSQNDNNLMGPNTAKESEINVGQTSSGTTAEHQMFTPTLGKVLQQTSENSDARDDQGSHCKGVKRQIVFGTISEADLLLQDSKQSNNSDDAAADSGTPTKKAKGKAVN